MSFGTSDGSLTVNIDAYYTNVFTITACGPSTANAADCTTSSSLTVEVLQCSSYLNINPTWATHALANPIEIGIAGS